MSAAFAEMRRATVETDRAQFALRLGCALHNLPSALIAAATGEQLSIPSGAVFEDLDDYWERYLSQMLGSDPETSAWAARVLPDHAQALNTTT